MDQNRENREKDTEVNVEDIIARTLDSYESRRRQIEEAENYERQELRKWAIELAANTLTAGTDVNASIIPRANYIINFVLDK